MPDRTAWFEDLRARGQPVPQMHPDDFGAKIARILKFLETIKGEMSDPAVDAEQIVVMTSTAQEKD